MTGIQSKEIRTLKTLGMTKSEAEAFIQGVENRIRDEKKQEGLGDALSDAADLLIGAEVSLDVSSLIPHSRFQDERLFATIEGCNPSDQGVVLLASQATANFPLERLASGTPASQAEQKPSKRSIKK